MKPDRRTSLHWLVLAVLSGALLLSANTPSPAACDTEAPPCKGCGCKGGPGYREIATGRCVGFKDIDKKCGSPPQITLCAFENAPGTGANRECAAAPREKQKKKREEAD